MNEKQFNRVNEAWKDYATEDSDALERVAFLNGCAVFIEDIDNTAAWLKQIKPEEVSKEAWDCVTNALNVIGRECDDG